MPTYRRVPRKSEIQSLNSSVRRPGSGGNNKSPFTKYILTATAGITAAAIGFTGITFSNPEEVSENRIFTTNRAPYVTANTTTSKVVPKPEYDDDNENSGSGDSVVDSNNAETTTDPTIPGVGEFTSSGVVGDTMLVPPNTGDAIVVSRGTDVGNQQAVVASKDVWSIETTCYYHSGGGSLYGRRLTCVRNNYTTNKDSAGELFTVQVDGIGTCYTGAMIEGFAGIGEVVKVTLDDGTIFHFVIVDVKSKSHTNAQLGSSQIQCDFGHGYLTNSGTEVQLSICEFVCAGSTMPHYSAMQYTNGGFLTNRRVAKAERTGTILQTLADQR